MGFIFHSLDEIFAATDTFSFGVGDAIDGRLVSVGGAASTIELKAMSPAISDSVVISGANALAVVSGDDTGIVNEDEVGTISGDLNSTGADGSDVSFNAETVNGTYGDLTIDAAGNWSYNLDEANGNVQGLAQGETLTDTITISAADGTEHDIIVTINGVNDAATFSGDDTATVTELTFSRAIGELDAADIDGNADVFNAATVNSTYGSLVINAEGTWFYELDETLSAVNSLNEDDSLTDTVTVQAEDGTEHDITITINGTNDAAVVSGDDTGSIGENDTGTISGTLTHTDVDNTDNVFTAETVNGTYGELTIDAAGNWTYDVDETDPAFDALDTGLTLEDTLTVQTEDSTEHDVIVTINGANEPGLIG